jgi:alginate O-acetyltransferase complex protein AlgI
MAVLFNTTGYLIFFIFVVLVTAALHKKKYQHLFLLVASYYFYWVSGSFLFLLMIFISLVTFYCGSGIADPSSSQKQKKIFLFIATVTSLGLLAFFKYFNFTVDSTNSLFFLLHIPYSIPVFDIILPIGISFYTFHALSYIFDIYLQKIEPSKSLLEYTLYIAFFPQLVAGPIVRAREFLPQLKNRIGIRPENIKAGITLMSVGIIKKVIIADNLAYYVNLVFSNQTVPIQNTNSFFIIAGTVLFGLQIFFDFSGYIDIALGSAKVLGFELPQNFNRPYFSASPTEFWRRWNITLSSFIRDYLYIPLGGNRKGKLRTYVNLMISMVLCGLWHGAAWNFLIWGAYHGVLLSAHKFIVDKNPLNYFRRVLKRSDSPVSSGDTDSSFGVRIQEKVQTITPSLVFKILVTQYFIFLGWLIFRVQSLPDLLSAVQKFVFIDVQSVLNGLIKYTDIIQTNVVLFGAFFAIVVVLFFTRIRTGGIAALVNFDYVDYLQNLKLAYWGVYIMIVVLVLLCFSPSASPEFIYFQF